MKILHLSTYDLTGGAARAAYRVHRCLVRYGMQSEMFVRKKTSKDATVRTRTDLFGRFYFQTLPLMDRLYGKLQRSGDDVQRSFNPAPTFSLRRHANPDSYDVVVLHFLGHGFLTNRDIGRINRPIVWLLHDMWPFCGAEHYTENNRRSIEGYSRENRPPSAHGLDLDRRTWRSKEKNWRKSNMTVVGASQWISSLAQESALFRDLRHETIPYPMEPTVYKPQDRAAARALFNLPSSRKLVLFGAVGALHDKRKGFDLLLESVQILARRRTDFDLVVFGNRLDDRFDDLNVPCHAIGTLHDDYSLAMLYSAADVMLVPSRMDNLPQTALESLCCGTPVIAFDVGGISDMVKHQINGYLAAPFSTEEFSAGMDWALSAVDQNLSREARTLTVEFTDEQRIGQRYNELFQSLLAAAPRSGG
jgi:glycosyltransferase involved in cell wall biosynthesis